MTSQSKHDQASTEASPVINKTIFPFVTPPWAKQGSFRYIRLDGGPCAADKAHLSGWPFTQDQLTTLSHLYTLHRDKAFELLEEARINWIWLTWSVGFSWETEEEQRRQCTEMVEECRRRGIHTTAYMTGNNMFWHDLFCKNPESIGWLRRNAEGLPTTYFGQVERFLAQMDHPGWMALQKKRLQAAVEVGFESFFYDNCDPWRSGEEAVIAMSQELRRFTREDLHSDALFCFNYMPHRFPPYIRHADILDWTFCEGHTPPGVVDGQWTVVNPAHPAKYTASIFGERPVVYETCTIHGLDRMETNQRTISHKDASLVIAEAAAFGSTQSFYVEGGFIHRLVHGEKKDLEIWKHIGSTYRFLENLSPRLVDSHQVSRLLVVGDAAPDSDPSGAIEAGHGLFAFEWHEQVLAPLLKQSIPFDFCDVRAFSLQPIDKYKDILLLGLKRIPQEILGSLQEFTRHNRLFATGCDTEVEALATPFIPDVQGFDTFRATAPYQLTFSNGPYVLGNLLENPHGLALHIVNYAEEPVRNLEIALHLDASLLPAEYALEWFSPDAQTTIPKTIEKTPNGLQCRVPLLETWGLILIKYT